MRRASVQLGPASVHVGHLRRSPSRAGRESRAILAARPRGTALAAAAPDRRSKSMETNSQTATLGHGPKYDERYTFGEFDLDLSGAVLLRNGRPQKLNAKSIEVLGYLLKHR